MPTRPRLRQVAAGQSYEVNYFATKHGITRAQARELSRTQEEIGQKLDTLSNPGTQRKTLSDSGDRKELLDALDKQKERMNKLVDRAQQVSEQAENFVEQARAQGLPVSKLMRDRDGAFSKAFDQVVKRRRVQIVKAQFRAPQHECLRRTVCALDQTGVSEPDDPVRRTASPPDDRRIRRALPP